MRSWIVLTFILSCGRPPPQPMQLAIFFPIPGSLSLFPPPPFCTKPVIRAAFLPPALTHSGFVRVSAAARDGLGAITAPLHLDIMPSSSMPYQSLQTLACHNCTICIDIDFFLMFRIQKCYQLVGPLCDPVSAFLHPCTKNGPKLFFPLLPSVPNSAATAEKLIAPELTLAFVLPFPSNFLADEQGPS